MPELAAQHTYDLVRIQGEMKMNRYEIRHERHALEDVVPLKVPYRLDIEVCGACNFKCNFCPTNNEHYMESERHKVMSKATFEKLIDSIADMERNADGEQIKVVYLSGFGEPLLHKDFPDMVAYIKEKRICREVRAITNGSMLNPVLNRRIVSSGLDMIRISVEALSNVGYKAVCGIDLDFDDLVENVADLYKSSCHHGGGLKVSAKIINAAIVSQSDMDGFFRIFGPITHYAFVENVIGDNWPGYDFEQNEMSITVPEMRPWADICTFPLEFMMVCANGDILSCCSDWKHATAYGNIHDQSIGSAWDSNRLREFQLMHLMGKRGQIDFCRQCRTVSMDNIDGKEDVIIKRLECLKR